MSVRTRLALFAAGTLLWASPAAAQVEAVPVLRGSIRLGAAQPGAPPDGVESETVVLHRVAPDTAGEIDSTRVSPDGTFSFRLPAVPDPGGRADVYFASVEYDGILYFGDPITTAVQLDSVYVIRVYETSTVPVEGARLPVAVRYLVLEPAAAPSGAPPEQGGGWRVTDLIQVRNPGDETLVPADSGPVWSYPIPASAQRVQVGGGDVGPDATRVEGSRLVVGAPLPPGQRQVLLRYALESPELTVPVPGTTDTMELLVREPAPPLRVEGLDPDQPVQMETGTTYRRYVGTNLRDATVRIVEDEDAGAGALSPRWWAVILGSVLTVAGLYGVLRRNPGAGSGQDPSSPAGSPEEVRDRLLLEAARIDELLESGSVRDEEEEERLRRRREILLERLRGD